MVLFRTPGVISWFMNVTREVGICTHSRHWGHDWSRWAKGRMGWVDAPFLFPNHPYSLFSLNGNIRLPFRRHRCRKGVMSVPISSFLHLEASQMLFTPVEKFACGLAHWKVFPQSFTLSSCCLGVDTPTTKFHRHNDRFEASLGQLNICIRRFLRRLPGPHALIKPRALLVLFSQHHGRPAISTRLDHDGGEEWSGWSGGFCEFFWRWLIFGRRDSLPTGRDNRGVLARKIIRYRSGR